MISNLLALTTSGDGEAPLQIRHFVGFRYADKMTKLLSGFPDPPPTSLLRRGGLPLTFGIVRIFIEFDRLDLWRSNGVRYATPRAWVLTKFPVSCQRRLAAKKENG